MKDAEMAGKNAGWMERAFSTDIALRQEAIHVPNKIVLVSVEDTSVDELAFSRPRTPSLDADLNPLKTAKTAILSVK